MAAVEPVGHPSSVGGLRATGEEAATSASAIAGTLAEPYERMRSCLGEATMRPAEFRILLMGRTQAGKSTLLEALTGGDGARIGKGGQRSSRDIHERPLYAIPGVTVIDTPGVGAADGQEDYALALSAVPSSDMVLWVASSEPTHADTARALRQLAAFGKPIMIALNCRASLASPLRYQDFLDDPTFAFHGKEGHLKSVRRPLDDVGSMASTVVLVHADAAFRAAQGDADAETLRRHSRLDELVAALRSEVERNAEQRRIVRSFDALRGPGTELHHALSMAAAALKAAIDRRTAVANDVESRLTRLIDEHSEALQGELAQLVAARRSWHLSDSVKYDRDVNEAWRQESQGMLAEMNDALSHTTAEISEAIEAASRAIAEEWASLPLEDLRFTELPGFDDVWKNRLSRVGMDVLAAGAGALVGFVIGGPIGAIAGAIAVGLLQELSDFAKGMFEQLWKSKDQILRDRREKVAHQIGPILDAAAENGRLSAEKMRSDFLKVLAQRMEGVRQDIQGENRELRTWQDAALSLIATIHQGDAATARFLLSPTRRRPAQSIIRAARSPGLGIAVEMTEPAYSELVLFPTDTVEPIAAVSDRHGAGAALSAIPALANLVAGRIQVLSATREAVSLQLLDDFPSLGLQRSWEDLLTEFTQARVTVEVCPVVPDERGES